MCGRFKRSGPVEAVGRLFQLPEPPKVLQPRYNIAPGQPVPVVGLKPDGVTRGLAHLRWGLVPGWASSPRDVRPQANARCESVATKPTFRDSFKSKRCLIVADGYYEWFARDKPYLIHRRDDGPFAMAGLWELWTDGTERQVTCCLVTTPAAEWLQPIHDRMPLIVMPDQYDAWLDLGTSVARLLGCRRTHLRPRSSSRHIGGAVTGDAPALFG